jgi:ABC-type amino acid transport substrate-binding protein
LGVRLEQVQLPRESYPDALASGQIDVAMSGLRVSPGATELVSFSRPYAEESIALLVPDHRRAEFTQIESIRSRRLRIAIFHRPEWMEAETDLLNMVDTFIDTQRASGRLESARRQWILGEATRVHGPRCPSRDLLGWWKENR